MGAFVNGRPRTVEAAAARAADILAGSRLPLFCGLGTDMAGARAAVRLAERLGGAVDHMHSAALMRAVRTLQDHGAMHTTAGEARRRADLVVAIGPAAAASAALAHVAAGPPDAALGRTQERQVVRLGSGRDRSALPDLLGLIGADLNGRPTPGRTRLAGIAAAAAAAMRAARFGVAVWSPEDLDEVAIEQLSGIVRRLNETTRFTTLPVALTDNAEGVNTLMGWSCGYPLRTGFGRGFPEHDAWRFDAGRLVASGEADAVVWISTLSDTVPPWSGRQPVVALARPGCRFRRPPAVLIETGVPGEDHAGELFGALTGSIVAAPARRPSAAPPAAAILALIGERLGAA